MTSMESIAALGSVVQPMGRHTWVNTLHGAVLGGVFLALALAVTVLTLELRARDLTPHGVRVTLSWARLACLGLVVVGWAAVLTGTLGVDRWFMAAGPDSPAGLLRAHGYGAWVAAERVKEAAAWVSVVAASAAAYLVMRRGGQLPAPGPLRRRVAGLLTATLAFGGVAGVLGVLLTKLAPLL